MVRIHTSIHILQQQCENILNRAFSDIAWTLPAVLSGKLCECVCVCAYVQASAQVSTLQATHMSINQKHL